MQRWLAVSMFGLAALRPLAADTAAVLPFLNKTSSNPNLDWIGESVAETVREAFGITGLMTLDRNEVQEAYRRLGLRQELPLTEASIMKIGETLDAEQVVYGSFSFVPPTSGPMTAGSLRVTARVLDRRRMHAGPEFSETGALEDLATMEAHLAWRALTQIAPAMAPAEAEFRSLRTPIRLDAEENYIRGLLARSTEQKEKYFSQAAHLDPHFAHAYYQLGLIHYQRKEYKLAVASLEKVGLADIHAHEASFLLGLARFQSGDYKGAQQTFQMIAAAVPHLKALLTFLLCTGARVSEALELDWRDVDLKGARAIFWRTKSGKRRVVLLPGAAIMALANLQHREGPVFRWATVSTKEGAVKRITAYADRNREGGGQFKTAWRGALRRAGLNPALRPHDLRHTWASWHYSAHRDLLKLREEGGWSTIALVERYAHLLPVGHEEAIRTFWHQTGTAANLKEANL